MEANEPIITKKLTQAKINPVYWPAVPDYVEDCLITAVNQACQKFGDNQYEASKQIKVQL